MWDRIQKIIAVLCVVLLAVFLGCVAMQEAVIPCQLSPIAQDFVNNSGAPLPQLNPLLPWPSILDAKLLGMCVDYAHQWNQMTEGLNYEFAVNINQFHILASQQVAEALFDTDGIIGALLPSSLAGIACSVFVPRRKDSKKIKEQAHEIEALKATNHVT